MHQHSHLHLHLHLRLHLLPRLHSCTPRSIMYMCSLLIDPPSRAFVTKSITEFLKTTNLGKVADTAGCRKWCIELGILRQSKSRPGWRSDAAEVGTSTVGRSVAGRTIVGSARDSRHRNHVADYRCDPGG
ncbi:hypothetical protein K461DRAFT_58377 [Myriangium duriaei CBS 260.36]|uniref:Uncharacterized protein n=1 Tax=Myriangium duriaei CBS 260.36 TaxID=1168546 RepID=A0A9P4IT46_9PEZI|nr:hypothetical protein K461DRAFT_58377 [Myriangium duriaei CBS 260.36]